MATVNVHIVEEVARITLNRPSVRNAFNEQVIEELTEAFESLDAAIRAVVLTGEGTAFCAGADMNWMKRSVAFSEEENREDAAKMANLFRTIDETPRAVIGRINGPAMGGGLGLVACCDLAIAVDTAKFSFSEVRLGIVPAVISPFVMNKISPSMARRFFITGELFGAHQAQGMELVHRVVEPDRLDAVVQTATEAILKTGPRAVAEAKALVRTVASVSPRQAHSYTIDTIARLRTGEEAQEGFAAFLQKRKPQWPTAKD